MEHGVGDIVEGRVTGITNFGAFVSIDEGKQGLVHISEVANTFVRDVHEHLTVGQTVRVKILAIGDNGRINLSIKKALPPEPVSRPAGGQAGRTFSGPAAQAPRQPMTPEEAFEDKLKTFMADSNSRMSDWKHQNDRRSGARRPRQK